MSRPASILALGLAMMFATRADAETPACPPVTSLPGVVKVADDGARVPVGRVAITYDVLARSVCAAFTLNPKNAKDIQPGVICYDVSIYGRLTQRGEAVPTATMLDGGQREVRLDHEAEMQMSMAYMEYRDGCIGLMQVREPSS